MTDILQFAGRTHLVLIHFPIAFLVLLALHECVMIARAGRLDEPARGEWIGPLVLLTVLSAMAAAGTGWMYAAFDDHSATRVFLHRWVGVSSAAGALLVGLVFFIASKTRGPGWIVYRATVMLSCAACGFAGHLGGGLVHGEDFLLEPLQGPADVKVADAGQDDVEQGVSTGGDHELVPELTATAILEEHCFECHGPEKQKAAVRFDLIDEMFTGPRDTWIIIPGNPEQSIVYQLAALPVDHEDRMPPKGEGLSAEELEVLRTWIENGADR